MRRVNVLPRLWNGLRGLLRGKDTTTDSWGSVGGASLYVAQVGMAAACDCGRKLIAEVMEWLHISQSTLSQLLRVAVSPASGSRWTITRIPCWLSLCYTMLS